MADAIDPRVEAMEPPRAESSPDRPSSITGRNKLRPSHHPVLPPRKLRQPPVVIASPRKGILKMLFCGLGGHARSVPG
jgi:hypothetical protein